jgi:lysophospholipase L1-like esterase
MRDDPFFPNRLGMRSLQEALDANSPLDLVILQLGCNDLKHMFGLTAGMIAYSVEQLVMEAKKSYYGYPAPQILVIVPHPAHPRIGEMIFGFSFGPDAYWKSCEFSKWYSEMAARQGVALLDCAELNFELNELDGLHYSKADHKKLADAAYAKVLEILG